jgi:hypothetical protein
MRIFGPHPLPATHFVGTRPVEPGEGDGQPQRGAKGLKSLKGLKDLKSLSISGTAEKLIICHWHEK